jgi:glutaminyl-tRNA synthetase
MVKSIRGGTALDKKLNFIEEIVEEDLREGRKGGKVHTRFPPEPNGYLHIGHAKAILLNHGLAKKYGGEFNLRFDDTNPVKEDTEYVEAEKSDILWLGCPWDHLYFASDYFDKLYAYAQLLIRKGKAYVCDLSADEIREYRGTLTEPGKNSPYRDRSVEENLDLFERMKNGEFPDGARVLRAKIDMASPNMNMRDPLIYRIVHATHHNAGDKWCVYPLYDFAHPLEDAVEGITHSCCSLEFENHRPLYDWVIRECEIEIPPQQIEFARLNLTRTIMSKRFLKRLVDEGVVEGWDDPRMPTLVGLRRRGYTPESIRMLCEKAGVAKANSMVDIALLEHCIREDLSGKASRVMAVLHPIKVVLTNYPEDKHELLPVENNPEAPEMGMREVAFSRELYIEAEDFMEDPPKKFFRLRPGGEVRLKGAYIIRCEEVVKDGEGSIVELRCTYDPTSKSGEPGSERKVKGTLHWVDASTALDATVRLYDYLLDEDESKDYMERVNPNSVSIVQAKVEASLASAQPEQSFQFLRQGYFVADRHLFTAGNLVFNRIVGLRDSWAKANKK